MENEFQVGIDGFKLNEFISKGSLDFDAWTSLISEIEEAYPEDREKICLVYGSFLSEFPLCHVYWRKYADHTARLCTVDKVIEVFERAVQSATHSVGVWVDYCSFSMSVFEDPFDVRRLFRRGLSFVGKDYLCHTLWDKYIEFEFSQQQWISLAHIYIQTLRFPTKKLHHYYDSFKKLTAIWEERIERQRSSSMEEQSELVLDTEVTTCYDDDEILQVIKDLLDPSIGSFRSKVMQKYLFTGEQLYREACRLDTKIKSFETQIRRPYFHVKPLDDDQLENWHHYLDFVEMQWDFDWAVKLYERCLIPCANYPEFWMRYVEYMESKGGREIANFALDRATKNYLKSVPAIHLFNAQFKEKIGDVFGARAAFLECGTDLDTNFVENVIKEANMEKRLGNFVAASNIYEEALELAAMNQKLHTLPILYVHFSRLKFMISGRVDAAIDVLIDGIEQVPHCKLLLEELMNFAMMHGGPRHINAIDSMVANAISAGPDISQGFSSKDIEDISSLYLEFVDFCGSIHDVRKAWNRHIRLFSHSLRATSSYKHTATCRKPLNTATCRKPLNKATEKRNENVTCLPTQKQELSLPNNHRIESNQDITEQPQSEANNISLEKLQNVSPIVPEQSTEDASEPNLSTVLLHHPDDIESAQASPEYSEANDIQPEHGHEMEQDLKPLTLESLSLNSLDNKSLDSIPSTSYEFAVPQTTCISNGRALESNCDTNGSPFDSSLISTRPADSPEKLKESIPEGGQTNVNLCTSSPTGTPTANPPQMLSESIVDGGQNITGNTSISSPRDTPAADSSQIQTEPMMPSSSASPKLTEALSQAQVPSDDQHPLQKQVSQEQYPQAQMGAQKLISEVSSSQHLSRQIPNLQMGSEVENHYQAAGSLGTPPATHVWPMQNVQQQNFASPLVIQPVSYPQAQMCRYPMQSIDQSGLLQSGQEYNQMWQYYYYQQQQQLLVQQQYYLQQQQVQLQQQLLQQPQTHPQQQQLLQQYQQLQLQQQHNYFQQQQLQPPPFQQQHQSLLQQQPPNQQQYQQQLQQQQQQDQHQQYLQILQQQQQVILQQQPHQQQQEQEQQQPQITQMWNNNLYSQQASLQYYDSSSSASGMEASLQVVATQGQGSQTTTHASHPAPSPESQHQSSQNQ